MSVNWIGLLRDQGATPARARELAPALEAHAVKYGVTGNLRIAHFIGQTAHESGGFKWLAELWGPTPAQARYEGRDDLGNNEPGDGKRFKGRGLIQVTGRANYRRATRRLGHDFIARPQDLETPQFAVLSALDFWAANGLSAIADLDDVRGVTRRINGGFNGLADRIARTAKAKQFLED
jgi:putative chitinase